MSRRASRPSESSPEGTAEAVRETAVDMLRETLASPEMHIAQNAELRARLELTQRAERPAQERARLEEEHSRLQGEAERSKGFFWRLFGG